MSFDSAQFKRLERAGYNRIGSRYLAAAGARGELAEALIKAARIEPGQRVLDLASGPGLLARRAMDVVGTGGLAVASDISEGQLGCCPDLLRVAADGEALPFAAAGFDRVLCGLGLMFFPDDQAALREMRRVLPPPKAARPSIFRFGDPDALKRRLASADFCDIEIEAFRLVIEFTDAATYWQGFLDLTGGAAESLSRLPAEKQQALAAAVVEDLAPHAVPDGYRLASTVLIATAGPV